MSRDLPLCLSLRAAREASSSSSESRVSTTSQPGHPFPPQWHRRRPQQPGKRVSHSATPPGPRAQRATDRYRHGRRRQPCGRNPRWPRTRDCHRLCRTSWIASSTWVRGRRLRLCRARRLSQTIRVCVKCCRRRRVTAQRVLRNKDEGTSGRGVSAGGRTSLPQSASPLTCSEHRGK
ncbi:hypothetical protein AAT19DRAFT_16645 [Rhodotorula toruloides]|uniref:Uncharacterized protein n=1 Tax=Rhodotorula toruloides TaxID=5286 RepID=A0A2T0A3Y3_RHOTO|nr:hypothetical protein AAT19DRAFT_16645 [Rhodotorula toruloides]